MNADYAEKQKELWTKCCDFNRDHSIGTRVRFSIGRRVCESVTTGPATVIGTQIAVPVEGLDDYVFVNSIYVLPLAPRHELELVEV